MPGPEEAKFLMLGSDGESSARLLAAAKIFVERLETGKWLTRVIRAIGGGEYGAHRSKVASGRQADQRDDAQSFAFAEAA